MHANWDSRIRSLGIHYLATLLDLSLKRLKSLDDYFTTYSGSVLDFVQNMLGELALGIELSDLYRDKNNQTTAVPINLPTESATDKEKTAASPEAPVNPPTDSANDKQTEVEIVDLHDTTSTCMAVPQPQLIKRPPSKKELACQNAKKKRFEMIKRYSMVGVGSVDDAARRLNVELVNYRSTESFDLYEFWKKKTTNI